MAQNAGVVHMAATRDHGAQPRPLRTGHAHYAQGVDTQPAPSEPEDQDPAPSEPEDQDPALSEAEDQGPARPPRGLTVARFYHAPIVIAPSWFVLVVIIVALGTPVVGRLVPDTSQLGAVAIAALLAALLGISVLAHELGHCVVARILGIGVREVRLYLVGGVSELERPPASPREEALVAAAGPAVSAVLALGCWGLLLTTSYPSVAWLVLAEMALANGVVAVFNIAPALPLDGGRVLRAAVWRVTRRRRSGTMVAVVGGVVVALALLVWAVVLATWATRPALLQAALVAVMGFFVAAGAVAEWPRRPSRHTKDPRS